MGKKYGFVQKQFWKIFFLKKIWFWIFVEKKYFFYKKKQIWKYFLGKKNLEIFFSLFSRSNFGYKVKILHFIYRQKENRNLFFCLKRVNCISVVQDHFAFNYLFLDDGKLSPGRNSLLDNLWILRQFQHT